jgi:hypothetical protein
MEKGKQFQLLMEEAEDDLLLLQTEAFALQTEVNAGTGIEAELQCWKQQWQMKEQIFRSLATKSPIALSKEMRLLRTNSKSYIMRIKKAAKIPPVIFSCTAKTLPLQDVLNDVQCRRASFSRWLSNSPYLLLEKELVVQKQAYMLLKDIDILVKKVNKISKMRKEINGLKKAVSDTGNFLENNKSLISRWCSILTTSWEALKPYFPEEHGNVTNADVKSVLNSNTTQNNSLKTQEETLNDATDIESGQGFYQKNLDNQFTNQPEVSSTLQNEIDITDDDIEAILRDIETEIAKRNFNETPLPSEGADYTNIDYDWNSFVASTDTETKVQKAVDISNYEDNINFGSGAREEIFPPFAYEDGSSALCQTTAENSTVKQKQTCACNDEIMHDLLQEAYVSSDSLSWLDQLLERNEPDGGVIMNWEERPQIDEVLSNETTSESLPSIYTNTQLQNDHNSDHLGNHVSNPEQF